MWRFSLAATKMDGHMFDAMEVKPGVHGCDGLDTSREGQ